MESKFLLDINSPEIETIEYSTSIIKNNQNLLTKSLYKEGKYWLNDT